MILLKHSFLSRLKANRRDTDKVLSALLSVLAGLSALLLFLVVVFLGKEAWPVLSHGGWHMFLSDRGWYPLEGKFGLMPMILTSLAMMAGAIIIAVPFGLAGAIFVRFYAPPVFSKAYKAVMALLAGIPSVVFGLWGLTVLVPLIAQIKPPGSSLLAAILILALMILPTVALTSFAALDAIPRSILSGAQALGMTRKGKILFVAVPAARAGIVGGILLAMARALGETMAVLMVAGNVVQNPDSLFASVRALTANIALEMAYATDLHRASLFASGLFLTSVVFLLSRLASRSSEKVHYG